MCTYDTFASYMAQSSSSCTAPPPLIPMPTPAWTPPQFDAAEPVATWLPPVFTPTVAVPLTSNTSYIDLTVPSPRPTKIEQHNALGDDAASPRLIAVITIDD